MTSFVHDPATSWVKVWSYKEGLLSRVAHDLCIEATDWTAPVTLEGEAFSVAVEVKVHSLRVRGQVKRGQVTPLKDSDHREIEGNMTGRDVLDSVSSPVIRYEGDGKRGAGRIPVKGRLTLCGSTRDLPLNVKMIEEDDGFRVEGEVRFLQSTFGIKPFRALMGTLRVQDQVRVSWSVRYLPKADQVQHGH